MTIEEQVREALQRAGNERRVDVPALQASTKAVLEKPRGLASRWDRWAPVVLAATAAATVIGAVVLVPGIGGNDSDGGVSVSPDGGVDDTFTCPVHPEA
ncbi:MAG TPA: hypothetical protein VLI04_17380, partial [Nocardioidaceae bacterium]|nr:hypothetical protein [Nocardioidaceae bacterium]